jgi:hypothetical protein
MTRGTWRRGVVFVRELVQRGAIALVGRYLAMLNFVVDPIMLSPLPDRLALDFWWHHRKVQDRRWLVFFGACCRYISA